MPVNAHGVSKLELERMAGAPPRLPLGAHVFYHAEDVNSLGLEFLRAGAAHINSPPTRNIAARYPGDNVIAKAVLHLHGLVSGFREPLGVFQQDDAWEALARWEIDAMNEIELACRAVGASRTGPPCEAA